MIQLWWCFALTMTYIKINTQHVQNMQLVTVAYVGWHILHLHTAYYTVTYQISTYVGSSVINAENTMKHRYRLGPLPNLRDTNLSNSLEQISSHKRCWTIRRSKVSLDFSARLQAESPVLYWSAGFSSSAKRSPVSWSELEALTGSPGRELASCGWEQFLKFQHKWTAAAESRSQGMFIFLFYFHRLLSEKYWKHTLCVLIQQELDGLQISV